MSMTDTPVLPQKETSIRRFLVPSIIVAAVLILGGLGWFFGAVYAPTARPVAFALSALMLPADLHDARFISKPFEYRRTAFGYEGQPVQPGIATGMDSNGVSTLRLSKDYEGILSLKVDGVEVLTTDLPVALPSLSPDGYIIAYSQAISVSGRELAQKELGEASLVEPLYSMSYLYYPAVKKTVLLGAGAAPLFIDATHVLRFAPGGIIATDLMTGNETVLLEKPTLALGSPVLQSPDRSLISVTDRVLAKTYVYRVTPTTLETVAEFDATFIPSVLSNEALYELRTELGVATLWKYAFNGSAARKVNTLPKALRIEALSL